MGGGGGWGKLKVTFVVLLRTETARFVVVEAESAAVEPVSIIVAPNPT